jgi:hypothetical protein
MYVKPLNRLNLRSRQAGMTTLGVIFLIAFIGLFAFAGLRLTPVYLNYMKIAGVISGVQQEFDRENAGRSAMRNSISRRFDIESVGILSAQEVKVTKVDGGYEIAATYSHKVPFIANVSFIVDFDNRAIIRR